MKPTLKTIALIAAMSGLTTATQAQIVVWSQNFDSLAPGAYGSTTDFINDSGTPANPALNIVSPGFGGSGNAMALTFNCVSGVNVNLQSATLAYPTSGNVSANLSDYTLSFDMAVEGVDLVANQQVQLSLVGPGGNIFGGPASLGNITSGWGPAGSGYQHISLNLGTFTSASTPLDPTASGFSFGLGVVSYGNSMTASPETILVDNIQVTMVPEPGTWAILLGGLGLLAGWRRLRPAT